MPFLCADTCADECLILYANFYSNGVRWWRFHVPNCRRLTNFDRFRHVDGSLVIPAGFAGLASTAICLLWCLRKMISSSTWLTAWLVLVATLTSCPKLGDPHIETGLRVGPISNKTAGAVLQLTCGADTPAVLARGSYLWGGPLPRVGVECKDLAVCRARWNQSILARTVQCGEETYAYVFFAGLQITLKPQLAAVCRRLSEELGQIPFETSAEKTTVQWWSQVPTGETTAGVACVGK